jgi:hypothetical protein
MAVPQRLYTISKTILGCALVRTKNANEANIAEFQTLLNQALPINHDEGVQREMIRTMCYRSPRFKKFIANPANLMAAFVLWTEGLYIVRQFNLIGIVHIGWDKNRYVVSKFVEREKRTQRDGDAGAEAEADAEENDAEEDSADFPGSTDGADEEEAPKQVKPQATSAKRDSKKTGYSAAVKNGRSADVVAAVAPVSSQESSPVVAPTASDSNTEKATAIAAN